MKSVTVIQSYISWSIPRAFEAAHGGAILSRGVREPRAEETLWQAWRRAGDGRGGGRLASVLCIAISNSTDEQRSDEAAMMALASAKEA